MYRVIIFFLLIIPLTLLAPVVLHFFDRPWYVFPSILASDKRYIEITKSPSEAGGPLIEEFAYDSEKLLAAFAPGTNERLGESTGIAFRFDVKHPFVDISGYDYVRLKIGKATHRQRLRLVIRTAETDFSEADQKNKETIGNYAATVDITPLQPVYTIRMAAFSAEEPNDAGTSLSEHSTGVAIFNKVSAFRIFFKSGSGESEDGEIKSFIFEEIAFCREMGVYGYMVTGGLVIYYAALLITGLYVKRKSNDPLVRHKNPRFKMDRDVEAERIGTYIEEYYCCPDISTTKMQRVLGIPSFRIYNLIKEKYHQSFKQLINTIRIEEAKRLLEKSDLRIIDISCKVGYRDTSYFNKIFKQSTGISPTEYRERHGE